MSVATVQLSGSALHGVDAHLLPAYLMEQLPQTVKLGRIRPKALTPTLKLSAYLRPGLATIPPPPSTSWRQKAARALARMYLNDNYGDCVIAGKAHALAVWAANESGVDLEATDQEILSQYVDICGPGDRGCNISQVLDVMRTKGFLAGGQYYKIDNYVTVDWTNPLEVKVIQAIFGASCIGINLPRAWTQNSVWDVTNTQIVGGHDVTPIDYDDNGVYVASWGRIYLITWPAFTSRQWLEEMYVMLAPLWYANNNLAPNGIDVATLQADLAKLSSGQIPDAGPTPPLPPLPPPAPIPVPLPPSPSPSPTPGPNVNPLQQIVDGLFAQLEAAVNNSSLGFFRKRLALAVLRELQSLVDGLFNKSYAQSMDASITQGEIKTLIDIALTALGTIFAGNPAVSGIIAAIKAAVDLILKGQASSPLLPDLGPPPGQWR